MQGKWIYLRLLFLRLGIVLLLYSIFRILFYWLNNDLFENAPFIAFVAGIRFDLAAIVFLNIPFILALLLPFPWRRTRKYQGFTKILFYVCNIPGYILACIDLVFVPFTLKRSTADLLDMAMLGDDMKMLLPTFVVDFWYIIILFLLLVAFTEYLYKKTERLELPDLAFWKSLPVQATIMLVTGVFLAVVGRGGVQLTPINILIAGNYVGTEHFPLVLNTPFTVMQTLGKQVLPEPDFFPEQELDRIYSTTRYYSNGARITENTNVVVIILESFSSEYIGSISGNKSYTPFLDSLFDHGLLYTNGYANGHRSIEVLPSVFSSIPGLITDPYVISNYSGNKISSLAEVLKGRGYSSSFYHGGKNGTMAFDDYCNAAGFDAYFGKNEYPFDDDFDGVWGIYDEAYFQYYADQLNEMEPPFMSSVFSLSSHHPYHVPEPYTDEFSDGKIPLHNTIRYTDMSVKKFFQKASKMDWFKNTLFIITSDHTGKLTTAEYNNSVGSYRVPIFFYKPGSDLIGRDDRIVQHIDIMPAVLDLLGYEKPFFAFGSSSFDGSFDRWAIGFNNETYQLVQDDRVLLFDGTKSVGLYNILDIARSRDLLDLEPERLGVMEKRTKAIVQRFNNAMVRNLLTLE